MINWKPVDIEDKAIITAYYKNYKSEVSDYSFTQLLLWADAYNICYVEIEGFLIVKLQAPGETVPYIHMPVGSGDMNHVIEKVRRNFDEMQTTLTIRSITRSQYIDLKSQLNSHIKFKLLRDQYDYVYPSHDLSRLNTKKLKRKKDIYDKFAQKHDLKVTLINDCDSETLAALMEKWYLKYPKSTILDAERLGIEKVLNHWDALDTVGCVVKISDEPVAFTFGEPLTENMFLILIEKAIRDYKGAYVAVIKEFAHMYSREYKFVNREEDLGIPGLRKAKMLFRPSRFVEKGVAYFTNDMELHKNVTRRDES